VAPVAFEIILRPLIQFKPVERNTLCADSHESNSGAHLAVEAVLVHAEIAWGIAQPDKPRHDAWAMERSVCA